VIGVVWLLLVCVVRCWVKFCNECNFYCVLYYLYGIVERNLEEGGDDVKLVWFLCPGLYPRYNGRYNGW
jgi:hypothetical protein